MWEAQFRFGRKLDKISPETDAGNLGACALLIIQNRDDQVTPLADGQAILAAGRLQRADVDGAVAAVTAMRSSRILPDTRRA